MSMVSILNSKTKLEIECSSSNNIPGGGLQMNAYDAHIQFLIQAYKIIKANGQDFSIAILVYGKCLAMSATPRDLPFLLRTLPNSTIPIPNPANCCGSPAPPQSTWTRICESFIVSELSSIKLIICR